MNSLSPDASAAVPAAAAPRNGRNRVETEARLRRAVEDLLVEGGFGALTASAIGRRAGVDKMLIYRYFGDVEGLVRQIAEASDFFPNFVDGSGPGRAALLQLAPGERAAVMLESYAQDLLARPVVLELMVWELVERTALTAVMEEARERNGLKLMTDMFPETTDPDRLRAIAAVLTGGIAYLALRRRKIRWFNGVDLRSDEGWRQIVDGVAAMTKSVSL